MQTTRYRILEIMKEQGDVTVAELARQLEMAPVSVRHHLDVLQGENLISAPRAAAGHGGAAFAGLRVD
ncbi:MAG: ArsR family transcriptional regulator [Microthrixaceae bacterium]